MRELGRWRNLFSFSSFYLACIYDLGCGILASEIGLHLASKKATYGSERFLWKGRVARLVCNGLIEQELSRILLIYTVHAVVTIWLIAMLR